MVKSPNLATGPEKVSPSHPKLEIKPILARMILIRHVESYFEGKKP